MLIQILGSVCPKCKKLYELTQKAVEELGLKDQAEYITGESIRVDGGALAGRISLPKSA